MRRGGSRQPLHVARGALTAQKNGKSMHEPVWFRWLGVAGIELCVGDRTLVTDPFFSRPPFRHIWLGRPEPDRALIAENVPRCESILVTHPHWDHLMDVPEVARQTGATVYGSANTRQFAVACGVSEERVRLIRAGDQLRAEPFRIEVLPAIHATLLGQPIFAGAMPRHPRLPPRLRDYRMDADFSFLLEIAGLRLLDWSSERAESAISADVLFIKPHHAQQAFYRDVLSAVRPRLVIPIHWDDFLRPLSRPLRPSFGFPAWSIPPLRRVDLNRFRQLIERFAPETTVFVPDIFRRYDLREWV